MADDDSDGDAHDEELGHVTVFEEGKGCGFPCVLTPSSLAAELAPDMPHSQVAEICLGMSTCFPHCFVLGYVKLNNCIGSESAAWLSRKSLCFVT